MPEQVIDASVALKWVVRGEPFRGKAMRLLRDARVNRIALIAPPLLIYEAESMLQRRLHHGRATLAATDAALTAF
jgi:hypothetical protein